MEGLLLLLLLRTPNKSLYVFFIIFKLYCNVMGGYIQDIFISTQKLQQTTVKLD
jgi:hypothetical protein